MENEVEFTIPGWMDSYMILIAFFGNMFLYIQAYKIWTTRKTAGLSKLAYFILLLGALSWGYRGVVGGSVPVRVGACLGITGSILVLYLINRFEKFDIIKFEEYTDIDRNERGPKVLNGNTRTLSWNLALNEEKLLINFEE